MSVCPATQELVEDLRIRGFRSHDGIEQGVVFRVTNPSYVALSRSVRAREDHDALGFPPWWGTQVHQTICPRLQVEWVLHS